MFALDSNLSAFNLSAMKPRFPKCNKILSSANQPIFWLLFVGAMAFVGFVKENWREIWFILLVGIMLSAFSIFFVKKAFKAKWIFRSVVPLILLTVGFGQWRWYLASRPLAIEFGEVVGKTIRLTMGTDSTEWDREKLERSGEVRFETVTIGEGFPLTVGITHGSLYFNAVFRGWDSPSEVRLVKNKFVGSSQRYDMNWKEDAFEIVDASTNVVFQIYERSKSHWVANLKSKTQSGMRVFYTEKGTFIDPSPERERSATISRIFKYPGWLNRGKVETGD